MFLEPFKLRCASFFTLYGSQDPFCFLHKHFLIQKAFEVSRQIRFEYSTAWHDINRAVIALNTVERFITKLFTRAPQSPK